MADDRPKNEKYLEWLDPKGSNFLGSGLPMKEAMMVRWIERFHQSFGQQARKERKRRLHFITELSIELRKVKEKITFATGLAEQVIEDLIEGDWDSVRMWRDHYGPDDPDMQQSGAAEAYSHFYELLCQICETIPVSGDEDISN
jgi:hypothetical protein